MPAAIRPGFTERDAVLNSSACFCKALSSNVSEPRCGGRLSYGGEASLQNVSGLFTQLFPSHTYITVLKPSNTQHEKRKNTADANDDAIPGATGQDLDTVVAGHSVINILALPQYCKEETKEMKLEYRQRYRILPRHQHSHQQTMQSSPT